MTVPNVESPREGSQEDDVLSDLEMIQRAYPHVPAQTRVEAEDAVRRLFYRNRLHIVWPFFRARLHLQLTERQFRENRFFRQTRHMDPVEVARILMSSRSRR